MVRGMFTSRSTVHTSGAFFNPDGTVNTRFQSKQHLIVDYVCAFFVRCPFFSEKFVDVEASNRPVTPRWRVNWINDRLDLSSTGFLQDFASTLLYASLSYSFTWECDKLKGLRSISICKAYLLPNYGEKRGCLCFF